jgi:hypothetical protein
MKKNFLLCCFALAMQLAVSQDYNNLDKEYRDIAMQALFKVSPVTLQWFKTTIQKHPAGNFDSTWAKTQLYSKFTNSQMNDAGELFVVMMAYLKLSQKEAREDKKMQRTSKEYSVVSSENKIVQDNKNINQQKSEATERYNTSMMAAKNQLNTGVVSGTTQSMSATDKNIRDTNRVKTPGSLRASMNFSDSVKFAKQTMGSKVEKSENIDRRKASLDNIQKSLDILKNMNPKL